MVQGGLLRASTRDNRGMNSDYKQLLRPSEDPRRHSVVPEPVIFRSRKTPQIPQRKHLSDIYATTVVHENDQEIEVSNLSYHK
uniref:Uncharacterized protein n=1 Tax=Panagrellus redivivus TaxID=6233 RepID=A0A7E4UWR2_PANRE